MKVFRVELKETGTRFSSFTVVADTAAQAKAILLGDEEGDYELDAEEMDVEEREFTEVKEVTPA